MFKIIVVVASVTGEMLGISFSVKSYDAQQCALNMLAATREVVKSFSDKQITTETRCVPTAQADALKRKIEAQQAPTDKLYDL